MEPMTRWAIYAVMLALGFAGGALHFRASQSPLPAGGASGGRSLKEWAEIQPGGVIESGENPPREGVEAAIRAKRGGLGSAMRAHLQLVQDTPVTDLPALLLRYEVMMPGAGPNSIGGLVQDAIVERLLAEDPDALLELALGGRSEHLGGDLQSVIGRLREHLSYEMLERKISSGEIPSVKMEVMQALLGHEISDDPERGWELALANGQVNFDRLVQEHPSPEVVERIILADSPHRLSDAAIALCFKSMPTGDPVASWEIIDSIEQAGERLAAIRGFGGALGLGSSPELLGEMAEGLRSDQERLALYNGSFATAMIETPWAGEGLRSRLLASVLEIDRPQVRQALLDHQLREWKAYAPDDAKIWAEEHGQLERFESLQSAEFQFPVGLQSFGADGQIEAFEAFVPPEIPSELQPAPAGDEVDEN